MKLFSCNLYQFGMFVLGPKDGKIIEDVEGHITAYLLDDGRTIFKDDRTKIGDKGEPIVKLIGEDYERYVYFVCPECGQIHGTYKDALYGRDRFRLPCTGVLAVDQEGWMSRTPQKYFTLDKDKEGWIPGTVGWPLCRPWKPWD